MDKPARSVPVPSTAAMLRSGDDQFDAVFLEAATRSLLLEIAPDELEVFDTDPGYYLAGPDGARADADEALGFGVEVVALLAPFVAKAVVVAARFVFDLMVDAARDQTKAAIGTWLKHLLTGEKPTEHPALPPDLPKRVHDLVLQTCRDAGLAERDAALVSDAVAGRLSLAA